MHALNQIVFTYVAPAQEKNHMIEISEVSKLPPNRKLHKVSINFLQFGKDEMCQLIYLSKIPTHVIMIITAL